MRTARRDEGCLVQETVIVAFDIQTANADGQQAEGVHSLADEVRVGSALADFHGLAPEAGTGSSRRTALPCPPRLPAASPSYSPTALAAFSRNSEPSRM
jgi:hypothetical protein